MAGQPDIRSDLRDIRTRLFRVERMPHSGGGGGGATGPTGPSGPTGPTGPSGATGATGSGGGTTFAKGTGSTSTNSVGQISVNHGLGTAPSQVFVQIGSNQNWIATNIGKGLSTIQFTVRVANTGATLNNTSVQFDWMAIP